MCVCVQCVPRVRCALDTCGVHSALCPRHVATAPTWCPGRPWSWSTGRVGAYSLGPSACSGWAWGCLGAGTPLTPRSTRARVARVLQDQGCHGAEETSAGLGSAESGLAGKGAPIPEPGPSIPALQRADVPVLRVHHLAAPQGCSLAGVPAGRSLPCARTTQLWGPGAASHVSCSSPGRQCGVQAGAGISGDRWTVGIPCGLQK